MTTDMNDNYQPGADLRWQSSALMALQEATEAYLVHLFEDAYVRCSSWQIVGKITTYAQKFMCYSRKTGNNHATGHSTGPADSR